MERCVYDVRYTFHVKLSVWNVVFMMFGTRFMLNLFVAINNFENTHKRNWRINLEGGREGDEIDHGHFFPFGDSPPVGQDLLIYEVSRSHSMTHHCR
jgi:hypothetical protein